jgi:hypothetical protein
MHDVARSLMDYFHFRGSRYTNPEDGVAEPEPEQTSRPAVLVA